MFSAVRSAATSLLICASISAPAFARKAVDEAYEQIPAGAFSVVAQIRAKPGKEAALRAATLPLIALVRSDPKNLIYFLQEDRTAPGHFIFFEVFANEKDFEAHNNQPYVKEWFAILPELADGGVETLKMEILRRPGK